MEKYLVTGMSCAACSARVEKAVSAVDGVTSCSVSLLTNTMGVEGTASPEAVVAAVVNAGYGARPLDAPEKGAADAKDAHASSTVSEEMLEDRDTPVLKRRLVRSLILLVPLMYVAMGHTMGGFPLPSFFEGNPLGVGLVQMVLAFAVMTVNRKFFVNGLHGVLNRAPNMDTLVALGSGASFAWSFVVLLGMTRAAADGDAEALRQGLHGLYFESAAMILALITVGKMLEARSKGRTTDALKSLLRLSPKTATVESDGKEKSVPVEEVKAGDVFVVRPGEHIPVDGVVLDGTSAVNEASLTGESVPVDKGAGDTVSAATLNQSGFLRCRATRVGEDTTLAQIIRMVGDAAATKAPIAKLADRVSGVFVPVVMGIALVTTLIWLLTGAELGFALARGIAVLVISCPCALGLATPVAIMVGNGLGARNGILFKTAASLEETGRVDIVALDKTGTITEGRPRVTDVVPAEGLSERDLLIPAFSLERLSEHPLARAVVERAGELGLEAKEVTDFRVLPGNGLEARVDGETLVGGSRAYVAGRVSLPVSLEEKAKAFAEEGKTPLFFARGEKALGCVAVADVIKPDSAEAVRELRDMGVRVVMITGDNERTARAVGRAAGVDEVVAGVLPAGKEEAVRALQKEGRVAMVGDGINDAPALTRADTGMAIGAGTDVAIDAADVVLMKSSLADVPAAIRLSRATLRNIRENLFWAFIYNIIGIPVAAGALYHAFGITLSPMIGAAAMSLSSFCVVSNALRLNFARIRPEGAPCPCAADARPAGDGTSNATAESPAGAEGTCCAATGTCAPTPTATGSANGIKSAASAPAAETAGQAATRTAAATPTTPTTTPHPSSSEDTAMTITIGVKGMMCAHCERHTKEALEKIDGVTSATCDHVAGTAVIEATRDVSDEELKAAVTGAGYEFTGRK